MSLSPRSHQALARHSEVQPQASRAAALISSGDRVATALGPREHWPQPLTTLVEVMLGSNQPMFVAWGPERTLLYNDPYAEILAAKHPDAMGQPLLDVWAEIRDDIEPIVDLTYQGEPVRMDDIALVMHRRGYPEETHFAFSYTPVRDQMGEVAGLFCTCIETTEQVSSGRKLRESEARFRAVQETSIDGFMVLESVRDEAGRLIDFRWAYANAAAERIVGKPPGWFIGRRMLEEMPGNRDDGLYDAYVRVVETGEPWATEFTYAHEDVAVHLRLTAAKVGDGFAVTFADLTERRRAELKIAQAATAIENMAEGFIILDTSFLIRQINAEGLRIDGRPADQIVGRHLLEVWPESERLPTWGVFQRALAERKTVEVVYRHTSDIHDVWLEVRAHPTEDGLAVFYRDVTERLNNERMLRENAERVQLALDAGAIVGTWVWDVPEDRFSADERFAAAFGLDPVLCRNGVSLEKIVASIHEDDKSRVSAAIGEALMHGGPYRCQYRVRAKDGVFRWIEANGRVELDAVGAPLRFPGILLDVEERRAIEAERDRVIAILQNFTDAVPGVVYAKDRQGRMLVANRGTSELVGKQPEVYLGKTDLEFLDDKVQALAVMENDRRVMESGVAEQFEEQVRMPDGTAAVWLSTKAPFRNVAGEVIGLIGASLDITTRKQAEADLEASRERLRQLNETLEQQISERTAKLLASEGLIRTFFDHSSECHAVLVDNNDGSFRYEEVNPATLRLYRKTREEVVGLTTNELFDEETATRLNESLSTCLRASAPWRYERIQGGRIIEAVSTPVLDTTGPSRRIVVSAHDVTERRGLEEQLRQAQKMEAVGQLTGGIAHDFNNLLTAISGSLEIMERRNAEGRLNDIARYITAAQDGARRAATLTQRLLAFSRRQTLDPKPTDVNKLISGMEDLLRRTVGPSVVLEVVGAGGLWPTKIDPSQLENALLNLTINARDAMPDGGRITIETANRWLDERAASERDLSPGQYISVCVTDTGTGMTPDVIAQAFDPFFTTKPLGQGTGLGLSMIHGFVRQSGGQVRIYSELGKGTTMCMYLPRISGTIDKLGRPEMLHATESGHGETVLVVDDDATVRMLMVEVLEEAGYVALEAGDGSAGLRILQSDARIDLLITDVGLPGGMNGRQLADAARTARSELKVLFVTGYAENAAIGHGFLDPGMQVITKPFAMAELGNKVRRMIED